MTDERLFASAELTAEFLESLSRELNPLPWLALEALSWQVFSYALPQRTSSELELSALLGPDRDLAQRYGLWLRAVALGEFSIEELIFMAEYQTTSNTWTNSIGISLLVASAIPC